MIFIKFLLQNARILQILPIRHIKRHFHSQKLKNNQINLLQNKLRLQILQLQFPLILIKFNYILLLVLPMLIIQFILLIHLHHLLQNLHQSILRKIIRKILLIRVICLYLYVICKLILINITLNIFQNTELTPLLVRSFFYQIGRL